MSTDVFLADAAFNRCRIVKYPSPVLNPVQNPGDVCYTRYFRTHLDHQKLMVFTILSNENYPFHFAPRLFVARERT